MSTPSHRALLEDLYQTAIAAADPGRATELAVLPLQLGSNAAIIALGKASARMAEGAARALKERGIVLSAGLAVNHAPDGIDAPGVAIIAGDHPEPGAASAHAAEEIGRFASKAREAEDVIVLLSGGASSLCAAPVDGVPLEAMRETFRVLLRSGAPIDVMNAFRRRILRWGAGRLAVALHPARIHCLIISDVIGNSIEAIASGPCVADPLAASDLLALRQQYSLTNLPYEYLNHLRRVAEGSEPETPKPANPAFREVETRIILDNAAVMDALRDEAQRRSIPMVADKEPLAGEAATSGSSIAAELIEHAKGWSTLGGSTRLVAWGGEPVVSIAASTAAGLGGRCQELALACARSLHDSREDGFGITVLAAGTDGRDGPTDAAGAVIDSTTWLGIRTAGRDPAADLSNHNSYEALKAAGALLVTGPTGTNVNDVVIAAIG